MTTFFRQIAPCALLAVAASALRAAEVSVRTSRAVDGCDSVWMVTVNAPGEVESSVLDADGNPVAGPFAAKQFSVADVTPWTAERPVCYTLVTEGEDGRTETVFGFSEQVLRDRRLFVNDTPVRLKLGPREWNGNTVSAETCTAAEAWTNGLYRIAPEHLTQLDVLRPRLLPEATRHFFQDWSVKATNYCQRFVVANRCSFLTGNDVTLRWTLLVDGEERDDGTVDLLGLKPGQQSAFDMPPEVIAARYREGTVSVRFSFFRKGSFFGAAEKIAEDQVDLVASRELNALGPRKHSWLDAVTFGLLQDKVGYAEAKEDETTVRRFTTGKAVFTFKEDWGRQVTYAKRGVWSDTPLVADLIPVRSRPDANGWIELAYPPQPVASRDGALAFSDWRETHGLIVAQRWTVYPDGTVACRSRLRVSVPSDRKERLGFGLVLPRWPARSPFFLFSRPLGSDVDVEWFGLGPQSMMAPGETEGAFLGRWKTTADMALAVEGVRGIRVGDLTVRTLGAPFAVTLWGDEDGTNLNLRGEPDEDGVVDLSFTLSVGDGDLTARTPADDEPLDFPTAVEPTSKRSETK